MIYFCSRWLCTISEHISLKDTCRKHTYRKVHTSDFIVFYTNLKILVQSAPVQETEHSWHPRSPIMVPSSKVVPFQKLFSPRISNILVSNIESLLICKLCRNGVREQHFVLVWCFSCNIILFWFTLTHWLMIIIIRISANQVFVRERLFHHFI